MDIGDLASKGIYTIGSVTCDRQMGAQKSKFGDYIVVCSPGWL